MASYSVRIESAARREIERVPARMRARVMVAIGELAEDPRPRGCEKLATTERYRIRVGDYRVVYTIGDSVVSVFVVRVGHRRDVYRGKA